MTPTLTEADLMRFLSVRDLERSGGYAGNPSDPAGRVQAPRTGRAPSGPAGPSAPGPAISTSNVGMANEGQGLGVAVSPSVVSGINMGLTGLGIFGGPIGAVAAAVGKAAMAANGFANSFQGRDPGINAPFSNPSPRATSPAPLGRGMDPDPASDPGAPGPGAPGAPGTTGSVASGTTGETGGIGAPGESGDGTGGVAGPGDGVGSGDWDRGGLIGRKSRPPISGKGHVMVKALPSEFITRPSETRKLLPALKDLNRPGSSPLERKVLSAQKPKAKTLSAREKRVLDFEQVHGDDEI